MYAGEKYAAFTIEQCQRDFRGVAFEESSS